MKTIPYFTKDQLRAANDTAREHKMANVLTDAFIDSLHDDIRMPVSNVEPGEVYTMRIVWNYAGDHVLLDYPSTAPLQMHLAEIDEQEFLSGLLQRMIREVFADQTSTVH